MFKTALYVTKGFVLSLFELLGCTWPRTQGSCAPLARSSRRVTLPCAPGASAVGRCLSLLTPVTHPVAASCTEAKGAGEELEVRHVPSPGARGRKNRKGNEHEQMHRQV